MDPAAEQRRAVKTTAANLISIIKRGSISPDLCDSRAEVIAGTNINFISVSPSE